MIYSMTAFARQEQHYDWGTLTLEMRSLNHRYLEVACRLPEGWRSLETKIQKKVSEQLKRGKVECSLRYQPGYTHSQALTINTIMVESILRAYGQISDRISSAVPIDPMRVLGFPGVVEHPEPIEEQLFETALTLLDHALKELLTMRSQEGMQIKEMISQRCLAMVPMLAQAQDCLPRALEHFRTKLTERLNSFTSSSIDNNRLEQEIVILAQKYDVEEELDRLEAHRLEVLKTLEKKEPIGRRLDFLMQELHREANTLSAKSPDLTLTQLSVDLKVLIEQMREQVQNIE